MSSHKAHNPLQVSQGMYNYLLDLSVRENEHLKNIRLATEGHPRAGMQGDTLQVNHMTLLLKLMGAKRGIEVGIFTGYTTLAFALTVPEDGKILALDVDESFVNIGKPHWEAAGVANKIELVLAPATETLQAKLDQNEAGSYDFAFIDADKVNYANYYELCFQLIRPGGVIIIDNILWSGKVINDSIQDADTNAIRKVNEIVSNDARVRISSIPIGDGVTFAVKL